MKKIKPLASLEGNGGEGFGRRRKKRGRNKKMLER